MYLYHCRTFICCALFLLQPKGILPFSSPRASRCRRVHLLLHPRSQCRNESIGSASRALGVSNTQLNSSWNNNNNNRWRRDDDDNDESQQFNGMGSTAAGAILGGLVGGPFGALWGASIGANVGAKRAQEAAQKAEMKRMGLTPEMVEMAQDCSIALNRAMEGLRASQSSLESQQSLARRLDRESDRLKDEARKALVEKQDEERARQLLTERQKLLDRLKPALQRCAEEKKRLETMKDNVNALEQRAMEIDSLIRRSVSAKTYQDVSLDDFDKRLALDNEDPLLRKFRELERDS